MHALPHSIPPRPHRTALMQRLSEHLSALGYLTDDLSDTELLVLSGRELSALAAERQQVAQRRDTEAYRLKHLALPSSEVDAWGLGNCLEVWKLCDAPPYLDRVQAGGVITDRRLENGEPRQLTLRIGPNTFTVHRKAGALSVCTSPGSASEGGFIAHLPGSVLPETPPEPIIRPRALKVFCWHSGLEENEYLIAAHSLREVNVILNRSGSNDFPHVFTSEKPEDQFALDHPLTLYARPHEYGSPTHPWSQTDTAPKYRAWIALRQLFNG